MVILSKRNFSLLYIPNTISQAADFKEGAAHSTVHTKLLGVPATKIVIWARVGDHAYASVTAPCILATYFGPVLPEVHKFISGGLRRYYQ